MRDKLKETLAQIFQEQNRGLLPDEANRQAETALRYYEQIKEAEMRLTGNYF